MLAAEVFEKTQTSPQKRDFFGQEKMSNGHVRRSGNRKAREFCILGKSYPESSRRTSNNQRIHHRSNSENSIVLPKTPKHPYIDASSENSPVGVMDEMLTLRKVGTTSNPKPLERIVDSFPSDSNEARAKKALRSTNSTWMTATLTMIPQTMSPMPSRIFP